MAFDRAQFAGILTAHQRALYSFVRALIPHPADADEVWQQTNMVLWQKAEQFQPETDFRAWALTVARYEVLNFLRNQKVRARVLSDVLVEQLAEQMQTLSEAEHSRLEALRGCLEKLSPGDRKMIELRYESAAGGENIAATVGRSVDAVYKVLTRIRKALLHCIRGRLAAEALP